ncbi:metal-dependent hydrolase [Sediminibacterium soli]|uniref:metal-dependent hydrolase n=1 Tax=Sediminibacterium soli TaxID=2698829 RepID=UPI00137A4D90|nr:metal-dependent hydrolase [Sediminibacterium soli]NCI45207.1 metal-dependent hydrolase [Sediminibacterium soli]
MDSITHIALGACIGEAFFEKGFGKKAMIWGALAQSIPDIDFLAAFWLDPSANLLAHRGITHSLLFAAVMIPAFAFTADHVHRPHDISFRKWLLFFATEILVHLFLDGYNNYGVGWFEPFSDIRFSLNAIYVADAFFSLWAGIAFVVLAVLNRFHRHRRFWWRFGVFLPAAYLLLCSYNKFRIDQEAREIFALQKIPHERYFTTPAPLQNWLWYVVAGDDSGYYVGFRSVLDQKKEIRFNYFPRNDSMLNPLMLREDVQHLVKFSQQFYTVEKWNDTLVFNDLRFGQIIGWDDPKARFVFHYFLQPATRDLAFMQKGRLEGWNREVLRKYWHRIFGN